MTEACRELSVECGMCPAESGRLDRRWVDQRAAVWRAALIVKRFYQRQALSMTTIRLSTTSRRGSFLPFSHREILP